MEIPKSEKSSAVSFANNFFVLADGLVPGIENYLAKDVALNWFGKSIRGKHKVAAFLKNSKVTTTHAFTNITSVDGFEYPTGRAKKSTLEVNNNLNDAEMGNQLRCKNTLNCECTDSMPEVDKSKQTSEEKANKCELNENDLNTLSSLDNTQMKHGANKSKVEEMMSQFKNIKMKCGHGDDPEMLDTKSNPSLKCLVAEGKLVCSEKLHKSGLHSNVHFVSAQHTWKRNCKLSIAYCNGKPEKVETQPRQPRERKTSRVSESQTSKLPSFDEVIAMSNRVVPDNDHFGGYLREYHFYSEQRKFVQDFKSEMAKHHEGESEAPARLNFKKLNNDNDFSFDYSIHYIGYESVDHADDENNN